MRRRRSFMKVVSVFVSAVFIFSFVVSCGGGGGGGGTSKANYNSASQAASSSKSVTGGISLSSSIAGSAGYTLSSLPTSAPNKRRKAANTNGIANLDPRLKSLVDRMSSDMKSSVMAKAVQKARSKTLSAVISQTTYTCGYSGDLTVSGSNTSNAGVYDEYTLDVSYNNCRESVTTDYTVINGSMHAYSKAMLDGSSYIDNASVTNLNLATYSTGSLSFTDAMNGTFNSTENYATNGDGSGTESANGSFVSTYPSGGMVESFTFSGVSDAWTSTGTYGTTDVTNEDIMNGTFVYDVSMSGSSVFKLTLSLSNLDDKITTYFADGSVDEWLNGTMSITWSPSDPNVCVPGSLTATTVTPLHYVSETAYWNGDCPISGELTVNNADIVFGTSITVTVGTDVATYPSCYDFTIAGQQCMM